VNISTDIFVLSTEEFMTLCTWLSL